MNCDKCNKEFDPKGFEKYHTGRDFIKGVVFYCVDCIKEMGLYPQFKTKHINNIEVMEAE